MYEYTYPSGTTQKDRRKFNADVMYSSNATGCKGTNKCWNNLLGKQDDDMTFNEAIGRCAFPLKVVFVNNTDKQIQFTFTIPSFQDGNTDLVKTYSLSAKQTKILDETIPWQNIFKFKVTNYNTIITQDETMSIGIKQKATVEGITDQYEKGIGSVNILSNREHNLSMDVQNTRYINVPTPNNPEARAKIKNATYTITFTLLCLCYEDGKCMTKEYCEEKTKKRNEAADLILKQRNDRRNNILFSMLKTLTIPSKQPTRISMNAKMNQKLEHNIGTVVNIEINENGVPTIDGKRLFIARTGRLYLGMGTYTLSVKNGERVSSVLFANLTSTSITDKGIILFKTESTTSKINMYNINMYYSKERRWHKKDKIKEGTKIISSSAKFNTVLVDLPLPVSNVLTGYTHPVELLIFPPWFTNAEKSTEIMNRWKTTDRYNFTEFASVSGSRNMSESHKKEWFIE